MSVKFLLRMNPEDGASDREWWIWAACGVGASPVEAYDNWVKDWERWCENRLSETQ